ncbi:MAG: nucleotidyltransferase domain-containing protein [Candidatus Brocadia sp.]|jgi:predicted nucleotidyltransferase
MSMINDIICNELQACDFIDFAVLFGSVVANKTTPVSDVDIGIYTSRNISLVELGLLVYRIEVIIKRKIDIVVMNDIYKKRPAFAYEIVKNGVVLFCKDPEGFIEFKKKAILYYLDNKYLTDEIDRRFKERLKSGRFGERNYVGAV